MKNFNKFITLALLAVVLMISTITPGVAAPKEIPSKPVAVSQIKNEFGIGGFLKIFKPFLALIGKSKSYRDVEKDVFVNMPDKMPKLWRSPKGAKVYSTSNPTALEMQIIDESIAKQIKNFELPFDNFEPADIGKRAKRFKDYSEYRIWLLDDDGNGRIAPAISPEIAGCPIIRTHNSATGYASGITAGFKMYWGGALKTIYPFVVVAKLTPEKLQDEKCVAHFRGTLQNENDHLLSSNNPVIFNYFRENDFHPFDW